MWVWDFLVWFEAQAICYQLIKMKDNGARTDISFDMPSCYTLYIIKFETMVIKS